MKKFKKLLTGLMNLSVVVVPMALLVLGFVLATGPVWDVLMFLGVMAIGVYAFRKCTEVRRGKSATASARFSVSMVGAILALILLGLQSIFCHLHGAECLVCEAAVTWFFFLTFISGIDTLLHDRPETKAQTWSIALCFSFCGICCLGGLFDLFEYFTGLEIPERVNNLFGTLAGITGIGAFVLIIIVVVQTMFGRK